jgi:hypothetical protein
MTGKGSKVRPYNKSKFDENFDKIFKNKKESKNEKPRQNTKPKS